MSFPFAQSHPECGDRSIHVTFLAEIALVERPEVVCHWHAVLIASSLQKDSDGPRALVNVGAGHPQNPVTASTRAPVADPLSCAIQQRQNGFVSPWGCRVDQLL